MLAGRDAGRFLPSVGAGCSDGVDSNATLSLARVDRIRRSIQKAMMFEFLVNRICPLLLIVGAVAAIDTRGNFVRKWLFEFFNQYELGHFARHLPF